MELKQDPEVMPGYDGRAFNRTLWNWNKQSNLQPLSRTTFNRTLWNWNVQVLIVKVQWISFNRTLWNWNSLPYEEEQADITLLIVPYGIETGLSLTSHSSKLLSFNRTLWNWNTFADLCRPLPTFLLIVPYGIETLLQHSVPTLFLTFNRTLWNWNKLVSSLSVFR